jgi:Ser/Thr protein kinase RdoA (MazF antagonist)
MSPTHLDHDSADRPRITPQEFIDVIGAWDFPRVTSVRDYPRGSRQAPKACFKAGDDEYLLKRHTASDGVERRIQFAHEIQLFLASHAYPTAGPVLATDGRSIVVHQGYYYELFRFITSRRCDASIEEIATCGGAMGKMHGILDQFPGEPPTGRGTYHANSEVKTVLGRLPRRLAMFPGAGPIKAIQETCDLLGVRYQAAADAVDATGALETPGTMIHGDWHPGNVRFHENGSIAAVLDFDRLRVAPRTIDLANGMLQFVQAAEARLTGSQTLQALGRSRLQAMVMGYGRHAPWPLEEEELEALPHLMVETIVVEAIVPIMHTGHVGHIPGTEVLASARVLCAWLHEHAEDIIDRFRRVTGQ